jgi:transposase
MVEVPNIMRALEPEVVGAVWAAVEPLLPPPDRSHPLGCHRPRVPDRLCFWAILIRLVTGASWVDIEAILDHRVSDTTLRARRDEWIAAGVFEQLKVEAMAAFDRIIELDLGDVSLDGSLHKAPYGGEGTGPNPTDRGKLGRKWSVASERHGVAIGWTIDGANRNDIRMLDATLAAVADASLLADIDTLHLDRGYDYPVVRQQLAAVGLHQLEIQRRGTKEPGKKQPASAGAAVDRRGHQLVAVELRRNTEPPKPASPRRPVPRHHGAHRRQAHHLPRAMEPRLSAYPLKS